MKRAAVLGAGIMGGGIAYQSASRGVPAFMKDIAPKGEKQDEDGWADVGHGTQDWPAIKAELDAQGVTHFVLEHDNPADHARFARRSLDTVQGW